MSSFSCTVKLLRTPKETVVANARAQGTLTVSASGIEFHATEDAAYRFSISFVEGVSEFMHLGVAHLLTLSLYNVQSQCTISSAQ